MTEGGKCDPNCPDGVCVVARVAKRSAIITRRPHLEAVLVPEQREYITSLLRRELRKAQRSIEREKWRLTEMQGYSTNSRGRQMVQLRLTRVQKWEEKILGCIEALKTETES